MATHTHLKAQIKESADEGFSHDFILAWKD